jgi:hypothetical protein
VADACHLFAKVAAPFALEFDASSGAAARFHSQHLGPMALFGIDSRDFPSFDEGSHVPGDRRGTGYHAGFSLRNVHAEDVLKVVDCDVGGFGQGLRRVTCI